MDKIVIGNWKMNPGTLVQAKELFSKISKQKSKHKVVVCPPFVYLPEIRKNSNVSLGAQNCHFEEKGTFTGEISVNMLKNLGVDFVLVGHSERRQMGETNEVVSLKAKAVLQAGLRPIICVGETEDEKQEGKTFSVIKEQVFSALCGLPKSKLENIVLAYEPVWAIGTGDACVPEEAVTANLFIRKAISTELSIKTHIPILYGGSVNFKNSAAYLQEDQIDGLLIGGSSLNADEFCKILQVE